MRFPYDLSFERRLRLRSRLPWRPVPTFAPDMQPTFRPDAVIDGAEHTRNAPATACFRSVMQIRMDHVGFSIVLTLDLSPPRLALWHHEGAS